MDKETTLHLCFYLLYVFYKYDFYIVYLFGDTSPCLLSIIYCILFLILFYSYYLFSSLCLILIIMRIDYYIE
jgi:hypothetical protein